MQSTAFAATALAIATPIVQLNYGDPEAIVEIDGANTGLTITFQGSNDGVKWVDLPCVDISTGIGITAYPLAISMPADSSSKGFVLIGLGYFTSYRVVTGALATGTPTCKGRTGTFNRPTSGNSPAAGGVTSLVATAAAAAYAISSPVAATLTDATTNALGVVATIEHDCSTLANTAAGFGAEFLFKLSTTTTAGQLAGYVGVSWATATHATRKGRLALVAYDSAGAREGIRVEANGTVAMVGLFGVTAVIQPATTGTVTGFTAGAADPVLSDSTFTGNTGTAAYTIGDIVLALKQLGALVA